MIGSRLEMSAKPSEQYHGKMKHTQLDLPQWAKQNDLALDVTMNDTYSMKIFQACCYIRQKQWRLVEVTHPVQSPDLLR